MDTDRNLLFGVLALQADLIDSDRFVKACTLWSTNKDQPFADLLIAQGWLTPGDRIDIEKLLQRKLARHAGDASASLAAVATERVRHSLAELNDADIEHALSCGVAPPTGLEVLRTIDYVPESRDRYTLSRLHATGGLGRVWLAHDASLGRDVALKEVRPEWTGQQQVAARFLREARITGQLEHPGIVPIYELGRQPENQQPFYTMRFIRGRTLAEAAAAYHQRRSQSEPTVMALRKLLSAFIGVCNAIAYAHSRRVLHRDLKPLNVILGDFGEVIVLDWGLARLLDDGEEAPDSQLPLAIEDRKAGEETVAGQVLGTPGFMAPEQAEGRVDRLDVRTDVYGLGAILYHVLTGQPPFVGTDQEVLLQKVIHEAPSRPRSLVPSLPPALEAVCLKALAKRPEHRYSSVRELADEIQHWLADEPVSAYQEPLAARAVRLARRHQGAVRAGAIVVAALLVGGAFAAWQAVVAKRAEHEAQAAGLAMQHARELAQAKEAETQAVLDFVENKVFAAARPRGQEGGLGRDATLGMAIETALPFVDQSFVTQPLIEARLRLTLGKSFLFLGNAALAVKQMELARTIYTRQLGADDPETAKSLKDLATAYGALGRRAEEHRLFQEALAILQSKLGPDHSQTLTAMQGMANSHYNLGHFADSAELNARILERRKAVLGPDHLDTLSTMNNLANSFNALSRSPEAYDLLVRTLERRKLVLGPDHPDTLSTMNNLANTYSYIGRNADALRLHQETLARSKATLGPDHARTLWSMNNVATALAFLDRLDESLKLYEETLALRKAKLGPDHPDVASNLYNIGCVHALMAAKSSDAKQADLAMNRLQQAVAAGYDRAAEFAKNPDFKAIRQRSDFQKLLADLPARSKKQP